MFDILKVIAPDTKWNCRIAKLIEDNAFIDPVAMGFPPKWKDEPFWALRDPTISPTAP